MARNKTAACMVGRLGDDAGSFTDDDLDEIIERLEGRRKLRRDAGDLSDDARRTFDDAARAAYELRLAAAVERRRAILDVKVMNEARQSIAAFSTPKSSAGTGAKPVETVTMVGGKKTVQRAPGGMNDVLGLKSLLASSNRRVDRARWSVNSLRAGRQRKFVRAMFAELKREGLLQYLEGRKIWGVGLGPGYLDRQIAAEIWELTSPNGRPGVSGSPEAQRVAQVIQKHMDIARIDQNRQGAFIEELRGYIANQSHDVMKLKTAGFAKWRDEVVPGLDVVRTFGSMLEGEQLDEALQGVYDTLTLGNLSDDLPIGPTLDKKMGVNEAKAASQRRVLHFLTSDDWMNYNDRYGRGSLLDSVVATQERAAHTAALMEVLGSNPRMTFEKLRGELMVLNKADAETVEALKSKQIDALLDAADGAVDRIHSPFWAGLGSKVRTWQSWSKLGAAVLSSITTDPIMQAHRLTYNGMNAFEAMKSSTIGLLNGNHAAGEHLGFGLQSMMNDIASRFNGTEDMEGWFGKMSNLFWKVNGMDVWDRFRQRGFVSAIASELYGARDKNWEALAPDLRTTLGSYGFTPIEWNLVRRFGVMEPEGGGGVLTPELMKHVPDSELLPMIGKRSPSAGALDRARDRLATLLDVYYTDQLDWAMLKPGIREKALVSAGHQRGTAVGELARSLFLFKQYPVQMYQRVLGSFAQEDHHFAIPGAMLAMPKSDMVRMSSLLAALMVGGYGATVLKDTSKGRTPQDPTNPKTWVAAFMQGGGFGIYGDFMFGLQSRYGTGPLAQFAGPIAADVENIIDLRSDVFALLWSDSPGKRADKIDKLYSDIFYFAKQDTPFLNMWYSRAALDYLVLYRIQDWLNPGSLRRVESKLKKDTGQEFYLPPSQVVN